MEISKVELFHHVWELEYDNQNFKGIIEEADFDRALQSAFAIDNDNSFEDHLLPMWNWQGYQENQ